MSSNCSYEAKTRDEIIKITKNAPHTIVKFEMEGCAHCHAIQPKLDNACETLNEKEMVVPFIKCNVGSREKPNKECYVAWQEAIKNLPPNERGFPTIVGINQGQPLSDSAWHVVGADESKLNVYVSKLHEILNGGGQASVENENLPPPPSPPQQVVNKSPLYKSIGRFVAEPRYQEQVKKLRYNHDGDTATPTFEPLCVPGGSCDKNAFKKAFRSFLHERYY